MSESKRSPGTVHVVSLGCSKAQVDAEAAIGHLVRAGWRLVPEAAGADLVVVNTCSFIEPAIRESIDTVVDLGALRESGEIGELVVSGCLVDRFGDELVGDLPEVDRFFGSGAFRQWAGQGGDRKILASPGPALPSAADERVLLNAPISPTSRSPRAATAPARSARSRRSAASSAAGPPTTSSKSCERWPPAACARAS